MELPADFFPQVLGYLLMDCPVIASEPEADPLKEGTWTSYGEFYAQLAKQVEDGLAIAKSRVSLWARTGSRPYLSGTSAFVLVMSLRAAAQETGIAFPEGKIQGDLPGPPWSEETVIEIIRLIFGEPSAKCLKDWMDKTAKDCFRSQPWNV